MHSNPCTLIFVLYSRAMIEEMGKEGSVPNANDKIDILAVMQELTSNGGGNGGQQVVSMGGIGSMGQGQGQFIVMMGGGGEPNDDDEEEVRTLCTLRRLAVPCISLCVCERCRCIRHVLREACMQCDVMQMCA